MDQQSLRVVKKKVAQTQAYAARLTKGERNGPHREPFPARPCLAADEPPEPTPDKADQNQFLALRKRNKTSRAVPREGGGETERERRWARELE